MTKLIQSGVLVNDKGFIKLISHDEVDGSFEENAPFVATLQFERLSDHGTFILLHPETGLRFKTPTWQVAKWLTGDTYTRMVGTCEGVISCIIGTFVMTYSNGLEEYTGGMEKAIEIYDLDRLQ